MHIYIYIGLRYAYSSLTSALRLSHSLIAYPGFTESRPVGFVPVITRLSPVLTAVLARVAYVCVATLFASAGSAPSSIGISQTVLTKPQKGDSLGESCLFHLYKL
jgi:hypothetical protein